MSNEGSFFGGYNLLDGMPLRRAGTILFAIEGRTVQLVIQSRQALSSYLPAKTAEDQEKAFLAALAQGRDLPLQPTIQDLERFTPEWRSLVPADPSQRAALAKKLSEKYAFRRQDIPAIGEALGLESEEVQQAFVRLFQQPVESIFADTIPAIQKVRWFSSRISNRLERLPPFWTAFSLTLTETVGGSILALPIALAGVGPVAGVAFLVILGLVNLLTVMGIVEAITRNGNIRYGNAYFGRLVGDYLGRPGSATLIPVLFLLNCISLVAYYVGISATLADISGISPLLWCVLILLASVYYLRGEGMNATVASALVIGMVNILILILLSLSAFPHIEMENLLRINLPFVDGQPFDPVIFELVFGVVLAAFFGHTSAANSAKVVLRRDPGGSALLWGNIAAMLTAIGLYSLWLVAVNGSIPAQELIETTGTALSPLGNLLGGPAPILGVVYVILAMGIGVVFMSFGLFYQVRELLPASLKKGRQFAISLAPIVLIFLLVEWLVYAGQESFSGLVSTMGAVLTPLLGGVFPILMLAASRQKGEYVPQRTFTFLGKPFLLGLVYLIYAGGVFVYGLFIWDAPLQRIVALGMGIVVLVIPVLVIRRGAFTAHAVVELKIAALDSFEHATLSLTDRGKLRTCQVYLDFGNKTETAHGTNLEISNTRELRSLRLEFPALESRTLKVWVHRVTPEGNSEVLPASIKLLRDEQAEDLQTDPRTGQSLIRLVPQASGVEISL